MTLLDVPVIIVGGLAFGFEPVDVELLEMCHVAQSFRYSMYLPSHFVVLDLEIQRSRRRRCLVRVVKVDGVPLERQQREIYQTYVSFVISKLPEIDKYCNRCLGYSGRGFGMDLSVRTEYCPVEKTVGIPIKFVVRENWVDHEAVDVIAKLSRKPYQWECRPIMSLFSLHVSRNWWSPGQC